MIIKLVIFFDSSVQSERKLYSAVYIVYIVCMHLCL